MFRFLGFLLAVTHLTFTAAIMREAPNGSVAEIFLILVFLGTSAWITSSMREAQPYKVTIIERKSDAD